MTFDKFDFLKLSYKMLKYIILCIFIVYANFSQIVNPTTNEIRLVLIFAPWDVKSLNQLDIFDYLKLLYKDKIAFLLVEYSSKEAYVKHFPNFEQIPSYYLFYGAFDAIKYEGPQLLHYLQSYLDTILYNPYTHVKSLKQMEYLYQNMQFTLIYCMTRGINHKFENYLNQILLYQSKNIDLNVIAFGLVTDLEYCGLNNIQDKDDYFVFYDTYAHEEKYFKAAQMISLPYIEELVSKMFILTPLSRITNHYSLANSIFKAPEPGKVLFYNSHFNSQSVVLNNSQSTIYMGITHLPLSGFNPIYTLLKNVQQSVAKARNSQGTEETFVYDDLSKFELYNTTISNCVIFANDKVSKENYFNTCPNIDRPDLIQPLLTYIDMNRNLRPIITSPVTFKLHASYLKTFLNLKLANPNKIADFMSSTSFRGDNICTELLRFHVAIREHVVNDKILNDQQNNIKFLTHLKATTHQQIKNLARVMTALSPKTLNKTVQMILLDPAVDSTILNLITNKPKIDFKDWRWQSLMIIEHETHKKYMLEGENLNVASMLSFINDYNEQKLRPYLRAKLLPPTPPQNVIEVNGVNMESIVFDDKTDAMVLYYANYCGFCQSIDHLYQRLARDFEQLNVKFTRIDCSLNDLPRNIAIKNVPTLRYYPAFRKHESVTYPDNHTWSYESLVTFTLKNVLEKRAELTLSIVSNLNVFDIHKLKSITRERINNTSNPDFNFDLCNKLRSFSTNQNCRTFFYWHKIMSQFNLL